MRAGLVFFTAALFYSAAAAPLSVVTAPTLTTKIEMILAMSDKTAAPNGVPTSCTEKISGDMSLCNNKGEISATLLDIKQAKINTGSYLGVTRMCEIKPRDKNLQVIVDHPVASPTVGAKPAAPVVKPAYYAVQCNTFTNGKSNPRFGLIITNKDA
jgi:hypothetical protein